ncbi:MAG: tetratricopeptide repeat protein [Lysobacteraceae bacterium]|nr:MAG: tetratricopeptide repeat protein [Xanthomonadaceae bacterium]
MPAMIRIAFGALFSMALAGSAWAAPDKAPSADVLTPVMAGEFALQAGQLAEASRWYLEAAQVEDDAGLAERATRIALLANDDARATRALALWRQRAPQSLAMRAAEAALALRKRDAKGARRELDALLRDEGDVGWRYALTVLGSGGRDPELSARLLGELVDADAIPSKLQAWLAFGGLAQSLEQAALAERIVGGAAKRFPDEPRVALLHASQLRRAGDNGAATGVLASLAGAALKSPEMRLAIAAEYDALGNPAQAAATLGQGPQDNQSYGLRASLLAKAEDNAALEQLYAELAREASAPDPVRRLLLGQIAQFLKRPQQALEWYRGVPGGPQRTEARLRIANVLFDLGRKDEAFADTRQLQGDASADDDARRGAYLLEAELRQKDNDDAGELEALARGLAAYPDDNALLYARGLAWERRDRIDRAEADLRRILVTEPENVAALNALGYTLADRTTRYQEALELIDRARAAEPDQPAIIDSYGWVLYRLGRHAEALVELRRAFILQKDAEIAAHIAEVLWVTGQKEEARKYFEESRKLDAENRSLLRALEKTGA